MIPTLSGRWQTRLFLFLIPGLPVTFLYAIYISNGVYIPEVMNIFFGFLAAILIVGLILDPIYIFIQGFRWDRDWPFAFQLFFSFIEFGIVLALARLDLVPWLNGLDFRAPGAIWISFWHFFWVFVPGFLALLGVLQIFFIRYRFKAGQFGRL